MGFVVEAVDVEDFAEAVFPCIGVVAADGDFAGGIRFVEEADEFLSYFFAASGALFVDFVAGAPADDAGVVAVAFDEVLEVFDVPVFPEDVVAVGFVVFLMFPDVEEFVVDEDAHAVARFQQFGSGRVV